MQQISEEHIGEIEQRIIEACKRDSGHTQNLCSNDGNL